MTAPQFFRNFPQFSAIPLNFLQFFAIPLSFLQVFAIPLNFLQFFAIPLNFLQFFAIPLNFLQFFAIPLNFLQFFAMSRNFLQFAAVLRSFSAIAFCPSPSLACCCGIVSLFPFLSNSLGHVGATRAKEDCRVAASPRGHALQGNPCPARRGNRSGCVGGADPG